MEITQVDLRFAQIAFAAGQCKVLFDQSFIQHVDTSVPRSSRPVQSMDLSKLELSRLSRLDENRPASSMSMRTDHSTWTNPALRMGSRPKSPSEVSEATVATMRSISAEPKQSARNSQQLTTQQHLKPCTCDACGLRRTYMDQVLRRGRVKRSEALLETRMATEAAAAAQAATDAEAEKVELKRRARMEVEEYNRELSKLKARERYLDLKKRREKQDGGKLTFDHLNSTRKNDVGNSNLPTKDEMRAVLCEQVNRKEERYRNQLSETKTFYNEQQHRIDNEVKAELEHLVKDKREKQRERQRELDEQIELRNQTRIPICAAYSFGTDFKIPRHDDHRAIAAAKREELRLMNEESLMATAKKIDTMKLEKLVEQQQELEDLTSSIKEMNEEREFRDARQHETKLMMQEQWKQQMLDQRSRALETKRFLKDVGATTMLIGQMNDGSKTPPVKFSEQKPRAFHGHNGEPVKMFFDNL